MEYGGNVMEQGLKKKYNLVTAIAMVVGIVIGSGVFFKAEAVLKATGGDMPTGILAWAIVGLIMIVCSYSFAVMATRYERVNGIVDYAEVTMGKKYGYYIGWFMAIIYYPTLTSVLAWVSARFTMVMLGSSDITGGACMTIAGFYLIASYCLNALSPILAGKFQVSATFIKLVPLALMAVAGTIYGLANGTLVNNFTVGLTADQINGALADAGQTANYVANASPLFASIVSVAFAYEGWIIATSINSELKDSKRNLPKALIIGSLVVVSVYILYYVGLAGGIDKLQLIVSGQEGAKQAFMAVFSQGIGSLIFAFVVISCLGTLNGLMLGCTRGMYCLSVRNQGPNPRMFNQVDEKTNMPANSSIFGLLLCGVWLMFFYGANLVPKPWFGPVAFDTSELPIITLYAFYIPIFLCMTKSKDLNTFRRFIMPILSIIGCLFMVFAALYAHSRTGGKLAVWNTPVSWYLIIFAVVMAIGAFFYKKERDSGKNTI